MREGGIVGSIVRRRWMSSKHHIGMGETTMPPVARLQGWRQAVADRPAVRLVPGRCAEGAGERCIEVMACPVDSGDGDNGSSCRFEGRRA
jgi:hypothetical protein